MKSYYRRLDISNCILFLQYNVNIVIYFLQPIQSPSGVQVCMPSPLWRWHTCVPQETHKPMGVRTDGFRCFFRMLWALKLIRFSDETTHFAFFTHLWYMLYLPCFWHTSPRPRGSIVSEHIHWCKYVTNWYVMTCLLQHVNRPGFTAVLFITVTCIGRKENTRVFWRFKATDILAIYSILAFLQLSIILFLFTFLGNFQKGNTKNYFGCISNVKPFSMKCLKMSVWNYWWMIFRCLDVLNSQLKAWIFELLTVALQYI